MKLIKNTPNDRDKDIMNNYYMKEFELFDGEGFVTFNIYDIKEYSRQITVAISSQGRISVQTYELQEDEDGWFFEYGYWHTTRIDLSDFA